MGHTKEFEEALSLHPQIVKKAKFRLFNLRYIN